jgi:hypothetical protein
MREPIGASRITSGISTQVERRTASIRGLIHQILPSARSLNSAMAWQAKRKGERCRRRKGASCSHVIPGHPAGNVSSP